MSLFRTIIHPTDFDETSKEAFRVARQLARAVGAEVIVFHLVPPPAIIDRDGRVILDPKSPKPVDLWEQYRALAAGTPDVSVKFGVVVGARPEAKNLLKAEIRKLGQGALIVMGTHGRTGLSHFVWGSMAEEVVREFPCPVLVVKAPSPSSPQA